MGNGVETAKLLDIVCPSAKTNKEVKDLLPIFYELPLQVRLRRQTEVEIVCAERSHPRTLLGSIAYLDVDSNNWENNMVIPRFWKRKDIKSSVKEVVSIPAFRDLLGVH
jgi:hypothetical protein